MSYTARPKDGFVLGKFMPPHQGHVFMCEFARQYCERLTILVCSMDDEPIPGELRYQWMKELFPDCNVRWLRDNDAPQEPASEDDVDFWNYWGDRIIQSMGARCPDVVFASESYGHKLATTVGAQFVPVDITRTARNVSGTVICQDPYANWQYIPHVVRPYFTKRICLFGPESSGKSTLAKSLGEFYQTVVAPEYGRTYTEAFGHENLTHDDLQNIVTGHIASVAAAKRQANMILIEDTDPVLTAIWSDMLLGERNPWFAQYSDYADLYILTDIDIPWADDGTRYFSDIADRRRFFNLCEQELETRGVNYIKVSGSHVQRISSAVAAIDELLAQ